MSIGEKGNGAVISRNEPDMQLAELQNKIDSPGTSARDRLKAVVEFHSRFTFPFTSLVFAIIAVPLGIQNRRAGKSGGFTTSISIILAYYVLMSIVRTLAERGIAPPVLLLWIPNLIFFCMGWFFLRMASLEKTISLSFLINRMWFFRRVS
jgi:lipopolysaccharide export system permease protein